MKIAMYIKYDFRLSINCYWRHSRRNRAPLRWSDIGFRPNEIVSLFVILYVFFFVVIYLFFFFAEKTARGVFWIFFVTPAKKWSTARWSVLFYFSFPSGLIQTMYRSYATTYCIIHLNAHVLYYTVGDIPLLNNP